MEVEGDRSTILRRGRVPSHLYAGVGLFSSFLADAVGVTGSVQVVEGDRSGPRVRLVRNEYKVR